MTDPDISNWTFISARLGDDAYNCRGADIFLGFEYPHDAEVFKDAHSHGISPIGSFGSAVCEDFTFCAQSAGIYSTFRWDCADGSIALALPLWCANENNHRNLADEMSCGWGMLSFAIRGFQ